MGEQEQGIISADHLPQPEVGKAAHSLIQEFKQAILRTPEFAQALQDQYFSEEPYKKLGDPIKFRKGDYYYEVQYTILQKFLTLKKLHVSKLPVDKDTHDWTDESVKLDAFIDVRARQFVGGAIQSAKFFKEGKPELFTNTNTAIQKVRTFLNANF